jgi:hypothetical protein
MKLIVQGHDYAYVRNLFAKNEPAGRPSLLPTFYELTQPSSFKSGMLPFSCMGKIGWYWADNDHSKVEALDGTR